MDLGKSTAFQLKAHYFPSTVIKFNSCSPEEVKAQLNSVNKLVPNYFNNSPAVLDFSDANRSHQEIDFEKLMETLRQYQLIPIGIQGLIAKEEKIAQKLGLVIWRQQTSNIASQKRGTATEKSDASPKVYENHVITKPVRSGMRIYAQEQNLILLAPVSSGAECIADGDIHCYAPIRGRLLAGAKNNLKAQIFCQSLEAELMAIAGYYITSEELPENKTGYFQISLKQQKIEITNFAAERSKL